MFLKTISIYNKIMSNYHNFYKQNKNLLFDWRFFYKVITYKQIKFKYYYF